MLWEIMLLYIQAVLPMAKLQLRVQPLSLKAGGWASASGLGLLQAEPWGCGLSQDPAPMEDHPDTPRAAQVPRVKLLLCHMGIRDCAIPRYHRNAGWIALEPLHHAPGWGFLEDL